MSWLVVPLGYLLGAFPAAYIAGRISGDVDIRDVGDGNMGAANAFHKLGKKLGIAVGIIDIGKGAAAVLIAQAFTASQPLVLLAGAAAVAGHNWPVFLHFRGGRGVSTTIGILLVVLTLPMLIVFIPGGISLLIKRNIIITSAFLFIPLPFVCWWLGVPGLLTGYGVTLPCLVGLTHLITTRRQVRINKCA